MSNQQQRLGRAAVNSTLAVILVLVAILSPFVGAPATNVAAIAAAPAAQQPAAARSHADQTPDESWLITWDASTEGHTSEGGSVTRQSSVTASIVVNFYADGSSEYYANQYRATYFFEDEESGICPYGGQWHRHDWFKLLDPARYEGTGPVKPNGVMPWRSIPLSDTQWVVPAVNLSLGGFTVDYHSESQECGGPLHTSDERDPNSLLYLEYLTSYTRGALYSGDDGVARYDADTQVELRHNNYTYPLHVIEHLQIERLTGRDLTVRDIEVTQGLQLNNTIPLVQGRRTVVRAYIGIGAEPGPIANVTGRLRVYSGGTLLGELEPFNRAGSISAKQVPDWHKIDDTLNFELPWLWTQLPSLRFEVEVNPTRLVNEINYANNTRSVELLLRDCQPLKIGYMPIRFAPPGVTPASPGADIAFAHEWMRKVYPVADDELLYEPMPGMTWNKTLDGKTDEESFEKSGDLIDKLDVKRSMASDSGIERLVGWLPAGASQRYDSMWDTLASSRVAAWVEQVQAPRNLWRVLLAHELGYTYRAKHTQATTRGYHWFDVYERSIKPAMSSLGLADFMYDPSLLPEEDDWVSPETYNALYNKFCSGGSSTSRPAQAQAAADVLVISGNVSLTATQSGQLEPVFRTSGTERIPPAGSSYYVVLKNGTTELARYGFDAYLEPEASLTYTPTIASFALGVPYPAGLNRVDLTDRYSNTLTFRIASAHPPTVTVQFPNAAGLTLGGVETIQWAGSDPDGEALSYAVLYSKDTGVTWNAIGVGITETSYAVDFSTIPGSSSALIKVLASDGFHTAGDVSDQPFNVPAKPPVAGIVSPPDGAQFKVSEKIKLQGYAVDLEEGIVAPGSLSWSSDLDGALGAGSILEVTLSEGTHTITLNVGGGAASATTTVVVRTGPERFYVYLPLVIR